LIISFVVTVILGKLQMQILWEKSRFR